jgi:E3 ubiquitin-protein ligase EDD1
MQWAIRQREPPSSRTTAVTTGTTAQSSGLIYIDPSTLRRTTQCTVPAPTNTDNQQTMSTTTSQLARAFGIVIRQIADLLTMLQDYQALATNLPRVLEVSYQEAMELQMYLEFHLKVSLWDILFYIAKF